VVHITEYKLRGFSSIDPDGDPGEIISALVRILDEIEGDLDGIVTKDGGGFGCCRCCGWWGKKG